jgi:hypothetical protein
LEKSVGLKVDAGLERAFTQVVRWSIELIRFVGMA